VKNDFHLDLLFVQKDHQKLSFQSFNTHFSDERPSTATESFRQHEMHLQNHGLRLAKTLQCGVPTLGRDAMTDMLINRPSHSQPCLKHPNSCLVQRLFS
jgi:hypothetical protein